MVKVGGSQCVLAAILVLECTNYIFGIGILARKRRMAEENKAIVIAKEEGASLIRIDHNDYIRIRLDFELNML